MAMNRAIRSFMAPILGLAPFHLLFYSTLLGTQLYQTFVMTKLSYQALPPTSFRTLQKRVFPAYFKIQSLMLILVAATLPPRGPLSLLARKDILAAFSIAGVTAGLNLFVYGPATQAAMIEKVHQETRDTAKGDGGSPEAAMLARQFSRKHAASIHLNLITVGTTLWYGLILAARLSF